ncbi:hypothetical protein T484DRAFT_1912419 [Baffinella frigidus]|nr:hypothetical protein T484DRAFT_1912419 [Cryptophyta sp. CCMP2293]
MDKILADTLFGHTGETPSRPPPAFTRTVSTPVRRAAQTGQTGQTPFDQHAAVQNGPHPPRGDGPAAERAFGDQYAAVQNGPQPPCGDEPASERACGAPRSLQFSTLFLVSDPLGLAPALETQWRDPARTGDAPRAAALHEPPGLAPAREPHGREIHGRESPPPVDEHRAAALHDPLGALGGSPPPPAEPLPRAPPPGASAREAAPGVRAVTPTRDSPDRAPVRLHAPRPAGYARGISPANEEREAAWEDPLRCHAPLLASAREDPPPPTRGIPDPLAGNSPLNPQRSALRRGGSPPPSVPRELGPPREQLLGAAPFDQYGATRGPSPTPPPTRGFAATSPADPLRGSSPQAKQVMGVSSGGDGPAAGREGPASGRGGSSPPPADPLGAHALGGGSWRGASEREGDLKPASVLVDRVPSPLPSLAVRVDCVPSPLPSPSYEPEAPASANRTIRIVL